VRSGHTGCEGTEWESETSVRCRVGHGARGTRRTTVTAGERVGSMSEGYSVESASMSVLLRGNRGGTGSASVTVHGSSLGLVALTALGRIGQTGCEGTEWESETSVRCLVGHGARGTLRVVITAGECVGSLSQGYSVEAASLGLEQLGNRGGTGSASVTVHGSSLGMVSFTALGRMGQTGCEGTEWESETSVRCLVGQGIRGTRRVAMTAGERSGSGSAMYSVDVGSMSAATGSNRAGTGSMSVTVQGAGLGQVALTALGRVGQTGCEGTEWESETSVRCLVGSGVRGTRRMVVTAGEGGGSTSEAISFDMGSVSVSRRSNRAGTGSASVTLHGAGLGLVAFTAMGRIGQTGCEGTEWESEKSVRCRPGHGSRGSRRVTLTSGIVGGSMSETLSYDTGTMSAMRGANHASTGSASVTLHGASLGLAAFTSIGRFGQTGCEGTEWESETSVLCLTGHGFFQSQVIVLTTGVRLDSLSAAFSVDLVLVSSARPVKLPPNGFVDNSTFLVIGSGFRAGDLSVSARLSHSAFESTKWLAETSVHGRISAGLSWKPMLSVTAGNRVGSLSHSLTYVVPAITGVYPVNSPAVIGTSLDSSSITIFGTAFYVLTLKIKIGTLTNHDCAATNWLSSTSVVCKTGANKLGSTHSFMMETAAGDASISQVLSFDVPSLRSWNTSDLNVRYNSPAFSFRNSTASPAYFSITVQGLNFIEGDYTQQARVGATAVEATKWTSDTFVLCKTAASGRGTLSVSVTAALRTGSMTAAYSADHNSMSVSQRQNQAATGGVSVTIFGAQLGAAWLSSVTGVGATACEATEWAAETSLRALASSSVRHTLRVSVTAGVMVATLTESLSFDTSIVAVLNSTVNVPAAGTTLTFNGRGFGMQDSTAGGRLGFTACETTLWESETMVKCKASLSDRFRSHRATLTLGGRSGSLTDAVTTDLASIAALASPLGNSPATGAVSMTVRGENFGVIAYSASIAMGPTACEATGWISDSSLQCYAMASSTTTASVSLTIARFRSTGTNMFTTDTASIISEVRNVSSQNAPVFAPSAFSSTVQGLNFGLYAYSTRKRVGATAVEATKWTSDTFVLCKTAASGRGTLSVSVTAALRTGSMTAAYSADHNSMSVSQRQNQAATGGVSVTIFGAQLGAAWLSSVTGVGATACEATEWAAETSLRALASSSVRHTLRVSVTAGVMVATLTESLSFDTSIVAVLNSTVNVPAAGTTLTFNGRGFGMQDSTAGGRLGFTACETTLWESETMVKCKASLSDRFRSHRATLTLGGRSGSLTDAVTTDLASIAALASPLGNSPATGAVSMTVRGENFGVIAYSASIAMGPTACEATGWISDSSLQCYAMASSTTTASVSLTIARFRSTGTNMFTTDTPAMSPLMVRYPNVSAKGSTRITLHGSNFRQWMFTIASTIGHTGCEASGWTSNTAITCMIMRGTGRTLGVAITAGGASHVGSTSSVVSYSGPFVSTGHIQNRAVFPQSDATSLSVVGSGFSSFYSTLQGRFAYSACKSTQWKSHTSITCLLSLAYGPAKSMTLTADGNTGSVTGLFTVDAPNFSALAPANGPTTGTVSVTLSGAGIGYYHATQIVQVGGTKCESTEWYSDTHIQCLASTSTSSSRGGVVTIAAAVATSTSLFSADTPSISVKNVTGRRLVTTDAVDSGLILVTANGAGFGSADYTKFGRVGLTAAETTPWVADTSIQCRVQQYVRGTRTLSVTAGGCSGTQTSAFTFYRPETAKAVSSNFASTGSTSITLIGSGFATESYTVMVMLGSTPGEASRWVSDTSLRCLSHGSLGGTMRVIVTTGEQAGSTTGVFSSDSPQLLGLNQTVYVIQQNRAQTGSASLTLYGLGFGHHCLSAIARVGLTAAEATQWASATSLHGMLARGASGTSRLVLTMGQSLGSISEYYSIDSLLISIRIRSNSASTGSTSVTVLGAGFGAGSGYSQNVRPGGSDCEGTRWESETSIQALAPLGAQGTRRVTVSVGSSAASLSTAFSVDTTTLSSAQKRNTVGSGSTSITIHGAGFGHMTLTSHMRVGQTSCEVTEWISDSTVSAFSARVEGKTRRVMVTAGERVSSASAVFSADIATVSTISGYNRGVTGSVSVTLFGAGLVGGVGFTSAGKTGQTACESTEWHSSTDLRCMISAGARGSRSAILTSGMIAGSSSRMYSFDSSDVSTFMQTNRASTGSTSVTVYGQFLLVDKLSAAMRLGLTALETTEWTSSSSLSCRVAVSSSRSMLAVMTAGEHSKSITEVFTFDVPVASALARTNLASTGATLVTIYGASLGRVAFTASGQQGETNCEGTEWESATSVRCMVAAGTAATRRISVTAGSSAASGSVALSYDVPVYLAQLVDDIGNRTTGNLSLVMCDFPTRIRTDNTTDDCFVRLSNAPGNFAGSVRLRGKNIGMSDLTSIARVGVSACETSEWESDSALTCKIAPAPKGTRHVIVTAEGRMGSSSGAISFDMPTISGSYQLSAAERDARLLANDTSVLNSSSFANRHMRGGLEIMQIGYSFTAAIYSHRVRTSFSACEASIWLSDSGLTCRVSSGQASTRRAAITAGTNAGSATEIMTYDRVVISSPRTRNIPSTGSTVITVEGLGFSLLTYTENARISHSSCEASLWSSATSMLCRSSRGVHSTRRVIVTAGSAPGSGSQMVSYSQLVLSSVSSFYSITGSPDTRITAANALSSGSSTLILNGLGMGGFDFSLVSRIGSTALELTSWESETSVIGLVTASQDRAGTQRVTLTAGSIAASLSQALSFDAPAMSTSRLQNFRALGISATTISGANFGLLLGTQLGRIGDSSCEVSIWNSETSIQCKKSHGAKGSRRIAVTASAVLGSATEVLSYQLATLLTPGYALMGHGAGHGMRVYSNRGASGMSQVTLLGLDLGLSMYTSTIRSGSTGCESTQWFSCSSVHGKVAHGSRSTRRTSVTSGQLSGSISQIHSYDVPVVSVMHRGNTPGALPGVSSTIAVAGSGVSRSSATERVRIGLTECEASIWQSDTSVAARVARGVHGTRKVLLTAGNQVGSGTQILSYDFLAAASSCGPTNQASAGSVSVTISGSSMGGLQSFATTLTTRLASSSCEASEWVSDTAVQCRVCSGVSSTLRVMATVGEQVASSSQAMSYDASAAFYLISSTMSVNRASMQESTFTVKGAGFGITRYSGHVTSGMTDSLSTRWISETSIAGKVARGTGATSPIVISVAVQVGTVTDILSVDIPAVKGIDFVRGKSNAATTGGSVVAFTLKNLGYNGASHTVEVRNLDTKCESTVWRSDVTVVCKAAAGLLRSMRIAVTSGVQVGSLTESASYDLPSPKTSNKANAPSFSRNVVDSFGSGFGKVLHTATGRTGNTQCETTLWSSDSTIICLVAAGRSRTSTFVVTAGLQSGSLSDMVSYDIAVLSSAVPRILATTGRTETTIFGSTFGTIGMRFAATSTESTVWTSDTSVSGKSTVGLSSTGKVMVTSGNQLGSSSEALSYDAVKISCAAPTNIVTRGGMNIITLAGAAMGVYHNCPEARLSTTSCEATTWDSDTALHARTSSGVGGTKQVLMTASLSVGSKTRSLSYDVPRAILLAGSNHRSIGTSSITVVGRSLGSLHYTQQSSVHATHCENSAWISDTMVRCKVAAGTYGTQRVVLTAGLNPASVTEGVSFDVPAGSKLPPAPQNFPAPGSKSLRLTKVHMDGVGKSSYTANGRIQSTSCATSEWLSDSALVCRVAAGTAKSLRALLTAGLQLGSHSLATSYDVAGASTISANVRPAGGSSMTVHGGNLGTIAYSSVTHGVTVSEMTMWESDSRIVCKVSAGLGRTIRVLLTSGISTGTLTEAVSYQSQSSRASTRQNLAATGSIVLRVSANNLGIMDLSLRVQIGVSAGESTRWVSQTSLLCQASSGTRGSISHVVTSGFTGGTITDILSYDAPSVLIAGPANLVWSQYLGISLLGTNFGQAGTTYRARLGSTAIVGMQLWKDDITVWCMVPRGVGRTQPISLTIHGKVGTVTETVSYLAPAVTSVWQGFTPDFTKPMTFTVRGKGMGYTSYSSRMRLGHSACAANDWVSDSTMKCRPVWTGGVIGAAGLNQVVTAGQAVGSVLSIFTYSAGTVTHVSYFNAPTLGGTAVTVTGFHGVSATQKARVGATACLTTQWQSASTVVCKLPMGIGGSAMDAIVTAGRQVYTLRGAITYDKYYASAFCFTQPDDNFIFIEGRNFGAYDATYNRKVGNFGCASSEWVSDTAAKCALFPDFKASQVTIAAVQELAMCSICTPPKVLDGCIKGVSAGNCEECAPCAAGSARQGCFFGGFTRGYCEPCRTGSQFSPAERTYKPDKGPANAECLPCTVCGGAEQDGTEYESESCTATSDTKCADCPVCEEGFLVGCAGTSQGKCVVLKGVKEIKATSQVSLSDSVVEQKSDDGSLQFLTIKSSQVKMSGAFTEVKLDIPAAVVVKMPPGVESAEIQLSAVDIPDDLKAASTKFRRSAGGTEYGIIGPVILLTPSGTQFAPPVALTVPFDASKVNRTLNNQRLAIYKWDAEVNEWTEVAGSMEIKPGVLATQTASFSLYTVIATPMTAPKVQVVATPLLDIADYANVITATEFVVKVDAVANAQGPYKKTGIRILKGTLVTFPVPGQSRIFVEFSDISREQADALALATNRVMVSEWVTSFTPGETKFAPAFNMTIPYKVDKVKAAGRRQSEGIRIAVHRWDKLNRKWQEIEGTYVLEDGVVTFYTNTFGVYAVMTVPVKAILLEPVEVKSPLNLTTVVPAAIGGTCLVLLCAVVSFAIHRRNRSKKEIEKLKSALDRRDEKTPEVDPSVIQLAQQFAAQEREDEKVSDQFQPADDVSALELSEHMAKKVGDSHDHVIDPSVLSLAQQLAESESPRISPTGGQVDPASLYPISSTQPSALSDAGLSQDEMASLLAGLAAAEKIQTGVPVAPAPSSASSASGPAKSRRPSKTSKKKRNGSSSEAGTELSAITEGGTLSSAQWAQAPAATGQGVMEAAASRLTLDALGLSLADTIAAMEADSQKGALTLESLGLTMDDLEDDQVVDAPEDIAERMSRILDTFGTNVGATADFVLVSQAIEPEVSYIQPPQNVAVASAREGAAVSRRQSDEAQRTLHQSVRETLDSRMMAQGGRAQSPAAVGLPHTPREAPPNASANLAGGSEITLDALGLNLGDLAGGADEIDDSVLSFAQQLAAEDSSPQM
jgi:hypothetical protein